MKDSECRHGFCKLDKVRRATTWLANPCWPLESQLSAHSIFSRVSSNTFYTSSRYDWYIWFNLNGRLIESSSPEAELVFLWRPNPQSWAHRFDIGSHFNFASDQSFVDLNSGFLADARPFSKHSPSGRFFWLTTLLARVSPRRWQIQTTAVVWLLQPWHVVL